MNNNRTWINNANKVLSYALGVLLLISFAIAPIYSTWIEAVVVGIPAALIESTLIS